MKLLTDEIIRQELLKASHSALVASIVLGAVVVLCVVITILLLIHYKKKEAEGVVLSKKQKQYFLIPLFIGLFFAIITFAIFWSGNRDKKAADHFAVSLESVKNKDKVTKKTRSTGRHGRTRTTTTYYIYFSQSGNKIVSSAIYNKTNIGDQFYVVTSDGNIIRFYDADEYNYEGNLTDVKRNRKSK